MSALQNYPTELWRILLELSPSLLLGLLVAGLMHVYLPRGWIEARLSGSGPGAVLRAVLIGVPMPLCSCGVVPTAIGLKNQGASRAAATAFLISTPQTGVDSVLVSASFLGWPFALFKVAAAFVTGVIGGALVGLVAPDEVKPQPTGGAAATPDQPRGGLLQAARYAVFELLAMIDLWIAGGVLVAALISTVVPADFFLGATWAQGPIGMLLVLALSLPLYVCTTGSVPIAASLIAAGMPTGTALVFLMAGPATNVATMGAVYRTLGLRVLGIYLGTVAVMSVLLGMSFDFVLGGAGAAAAHHHHETSWLATGSAITLLALLVVLSSQRLARRITAATHRGDEDNMDLILQVDGMSCQHCVANVKKTLEAFDEVEEANPDLATGRVKVRGGQLDSSALVAAIEKAGYKARAGA